MMKMGFSIGDITDQTNAGAIKGLQEPIACDCWFTSQGKTIPRAIKVMDEEGELHTFHEIRMLSVEERNYSGYPTIEHVCVIDINGKKVTVKLIYSKENCKWTLVKVS
jgi:hypothetical protein